jgi:hypothetical protein
MLVKMLVSDGVLFNSRYRMGWVKTGVPSSARFARVIGPA